MKCAVMGAGAWGTALASLLADNGHETTIWCLEPDVADTITHSAANPRFLPGAALSKTLRGTTDKAAALDGAELVLMAAPSHVLREVVSQARAWVAAAGGAPLRARRFADPAQAAIHRLIVETLAGIPDTGIVQAADALADVEPAMWTATLQTWVIDLQRVCAGAEPRYFPDRADRLRMLARRTGLAALDRLAARLDRAARAVGHPLNPRLMIEDALLDVRAALAG